MGFPSFSVGFLLSPVFSVLSPRFLSVLAEEDLAVKEKKYRLKLNMYDSHAILFLRHFFYYIYLLDFAFPLTASVFSAVFSIVLWGGEAGRFFLFSFVFANKGRSRAEIVRIETDLFRFQSVLFSFFFWYPLFTIIFRRFSNENSNHLHKEHG